LRDFLNSEGGRQVLSYATEYMIETASKGNANAEWIKGMGMLINHLKEVDELCQRKFNNERKM
jgi:hypothetical protein